MRTLRLALSGVARSACRRRWRFCKRWPATQGLVMNKCCITIQSKEHLWSLPCVWVGPLAVCRSR